VSLQLDQDLGFANLVNTVAYRNTVFRYNVDFDLGPNPYSLNNARQADDQLTEELQLLSRDIGSFTWVAGMYCTVPTMPTRPRTSIQRAGGQPGEAGYACQQRIRRENAFRGGLRAGHTGVAFG